MEEDKKGNLMTQQGKVQMEEESGEATQLERESSSELDLVYRQSLRQPFTTLSQEDSDLALARALQEQERAYMLLRMNAEPGEHDTSASGSYDHGDSIVGNGEIGDAFHVNSDESEGETLVAVQPDGVDASLFESDEAYAKALQDAEDREMTAQMMALAGINDWDEGGSDSSSRDAWQDVDPDNMLYEELVALGEVIGTQSRGLTSDLISALPVSKYVLQSPRSSNHDQCVICRLEFEEGDMMLTLPCKHQYHTECIKNWLQINRVCPVCSSEVSSGTAH